MDLEVQKLLEKADGNFAIFDSVAKAHSVLSGNCAFAYQMMKTVSAIDQLIEKRWSFCSVIHPGCLNS